MKSIFYFLKINSKLISSILIFSIIILCSSQIYSATNVSGIISTNTTWTKANSPYIVTGNIAVYGDTVNAAVLTIEPGVEVRFNIKKSVYDLTTIDWLWEGTATWIQDEDVKLLGENIDNFNHYKILSNRAQKIMDSTWISLTQRSYDAVLFWKYYTEQGKSIRSILEKYDALNPVSANNTDMLKAVGQALGDSALEYTEKYIKIIYKTNKAEALRNKSSKLDHYEYNNCFVAYGLRATDHGSRNSFVVCSGRACSAEC